MPSRLTKEDVEAQRHLAENLLTFMARSGATKEKVAQVYAKTLKGKNPKLALDAARDLAKMYGTNGDLSTSNVKVTIQWADRPPKD